MHFRMNDACVVRRNVHLSHSKRKDSLPPDSPDEVSHFKYHILASTEPPRCLRIRCETTNVIRRKDHNCELNFRVILEFFDYGSATVTLFMKKSLHSAQAAPENEQPFV